MIVLPSATHKDTSCCSHKAVPALPTWAQLFWSDVFTQRIHCLERSSPLKSTPAELWLNMWQVARGKCVSACLWVGYLHVFYTCVWQYGSMQGWSVDRCTGWRGSSWLSFGVGTAAFELLRIVWGHVREVSEDVLVGFITWKTAKMTAWTQLISIHLQINAITSGFLFLASHPLY